MCSDPKRIGNILKNHFENIGDKLVSEIPNAVSTILIPWTLRSILTYPDKEVVRRGVPHGSVLGPLLFLLYINNILKSSQESSFYLFADDTTLMYADEKTKHLSLH